MRKIAALGLVLMLTLATGCASISNSPAVSQSNKDGEYLSVVNKATFFMGYPVSNRNVVVRCNKKTDSCETLNLWTKDGYRIF